MARQVAKAVWNPSAGCLGVNAILRDAALPVGRMNTGTVAQWTGVNQA